MCVGYSPKAAPEDKKFMCHVGTVVGGPFQPNDRSGDGKRMSGPWYHVLVDGHDFDVVARILFPFNDPDPEVASADSKALAA